MKAGLDLGKKHAPTGYHKTEKSRSRALDTKPLKKNEPFCYIFAGSPLDYASFRLRPRAKNVTVPLSEVLHFHEIRTLARKRNQLNVQHSSIKRNVRPS